MNKKILTCIMMALLLMPRLTVYANETNQTLEELRAKKILWSKPYPEKSLNHKNLSNANKNYIGWLSFHFNVNDESYAVDIEEPIVFETETDYYLHHDFYNVPNKNGCIFMDYDSNSSLYGYSDYLYAHHADDGSLFGTLNHIYEFDDIPYIKDHPQYMYIYTDTACHKYVLIGYEQVEDSNDHYTYTTCENDDMYYEYVDYIKHIPYFVDSKEIDWSTNPPLMNFSTCDGPPGTSKRFVVHFAKIAAYRMN